MAEVSDLDEGKASYRDGMENVGNGRLASAATSLDIKMSKGVDEAR